MKDRVVYYDEQAKHRLTLQIQPTLIADAKTMATRNGMSVAAYIRLAIIEKMEKDHANE